MGLKQDVVVVNEFSVPLPSSNKSGKQGTRGGTPGDYVTRYMARDMATESLAPIRRQRTDAFILRYMAREEATESVEVHNRGQLKRRMSKAQGEGGVAFGYGQVSLSHDQLHSASADIQRLFDEGHTVMKTVLSFDQEYLRKHKIIPEDFVCEKRGDYRGHLDQMKLRLAVMHGLKRMNSALYDDLRYVGVIQVDTEHVHCHLAMVDAGPGQLAKDGTQRGKIGDRAKSFLRRGVDAWLDQKQIVKHLSSAVGYERRNVTTFVKRWAHQQMLRESLPQFLLACLPEDRRLWRSGTNHESMRKPNRIVHQIVGEVLEREGSPMTQAMVEVRAYADHRRKTEGLGIEQWERLVTTGRDRIVERGVNAVYSLLRQLPEDSLRVRTPMLDAMGLDYEAMAQRAHAEGEDADIVGFGFRLRSFAARLEHHTEQREQYHDLVRNWEAADDQGQASAGSRALYEFYLEEEEYHARCGSKYRSFLAFTPSTAVWYKDWTQVSEYGERVISLESMRRDQALRKTKDENEAERIGRDIYGQSGGRYVARGDQASAQTLEERVRRMRATYAGKVDDLRVQLAGQGLRLDLVTDPATGRDVAAVRAGAEYAFEDVKGLDLHHMRYDFAQDVEVGKRTLAAFTTAAGRRAGALEAAVAYLEDSGQGEAVAELPVNDVRMMARLAAEIASNPQAMLPSHVAELAREREILRRSRTVRLSTDLALQLTAQVEQVAFTSVLEDEAEAGIGSGVTAPGE
ncbi:relaxase MobL [Cryobacterium zhongshanensis]|uniref:Relaxase MobL n=1 Tax=Cryobacterium zhongshanensis TaxID=2928153 RepID=A0AA41QWT0_9MICO|nr:relaxase MobL [Cryobacterium zhongshanensis]MCI4659590.1 relaxase MobL [Cryobacterium zhongshanensis]